MNIRKVNSSDRVVLAGATFNTIADAVNSLQQRQGQTAAGASGSPNHDRSIISVKNNSGEARACFDVLGLDTPVFAPATALGAFKNAIVLNGVTPTDAHIGKYAVLLEPVKAGEIGLACAWGVTVCQVYIMSEYHGFAEASATSGCHLYTTFTGSAQLLYVAPYVNGNLRWAIVRIGNRHYPELFPVYVQVDGGAAGSATTACSFTYTVKDLLGNTLVKDGAGSPSTGMSPSKPRPAKGKLVAGGTYGLAFYHLDSHLVLWDAGETYEVKVCS